MNRTAKASTLAILISVLIVILASVVLLQSQQATANPSVTRLYCVSTDVNRGTEVTNHTYSHASDDSWYQIDSEKVGANYVINVEMIYNTTEDPATLVQIYVFSEAHVTDGANPVGMEIYNYASLLWESLFSVSATSDTNHEYFTTANFTQYISSGEMRLRVDYSAKGVIQSIYRDHTYIELTPGRPVASFTYSPTTPYTGETVTFNASASYDPDGTIVSYAWDFGDGTNGTGEVTTHTYADNGTYTVTLTVTDNDGLTDTESKPITVLNRPPTASFTESATTALTNEIIYFNASESYDPDGYIVTYFWDFGDGTNATGIIVDHAYTVGGNYTVTLTVTDDDGATASANATKTVLPNQAPVALFTESAETVYTGETITFNASTSYDSDGFITSYLWDFGDGTNATGVSVGHVYSDNGVYTVTLTVTDNDGAIDTATATKTILNRSPVASFTESATTVSTGTLIYFDASASYDPDGVIVSYFWDFGDGANASGVVVEHSYADDGNYTVTLTVTDDDGAIATASATKTILNRPPVASFTESAESVLVGEVIYFNASASYDPDGTIVSYFWEFGDGTNITGVIVEHAYSDDGTYTVTLTVIDDDGASSSISSTKTVLNRPPVAVFSESAESVLTGEVIYFNASSSYDLDGVIVTYFWDFGDGTNATGVIVDHAYTDDGTYTVTLTVTDDDGATATANATKTILNRSPVANFTESTETAYTGEVIYFNASDSYDPDGTIVSYFWDFGDGTNATGEVVEHAYAEDENYTVMLTVTDDDGASSSTSATKTVLNRSPVALFTESAESVVVGETIYFNASQSYDPDGTIVSYFWEFGDGTNATGVTAEHAYNDSGVYTVTLTVTDNDGATGTASVQKTVEVTPPVAIFTESAETVLTAEVIYFNASDSYDPDGYIVSYFWDFDDGTNATGGVVQHAYADNGNYTVTLTVTDDDGATDSASATKTVLNRPPVATFSESAETVYTEEMILFNASNSYDPDGSIVSYFWDFGDGANSIDVVIDHSYEDNGTYTVTLTITDDDGATATAISIKTVLNRPPEAVFTESATTVVTGEVIYFNASQSYDPDGAIVNYIWDFGDGANASGVVVEHSYADDGNYTVTLTVTDDDGAMASTTSTKTVLNRQPVAIFVESAETVYTSETITFNASASYDPDGSVVSYFWDFGDGANSTGVTVSHSYADNGTYTVTLIVTDDDGATDSATSTKYVNNRPPVASFTYTPNFPALGETVTFEASGSSDPDGYILSYRWDFGDGNVTTVTDPIIDHVYATIGNYTVTLNVTDDDGLSDLTSKILDVRVLVHDVAVVSVTPSASEVYSGQILNVTVVVRNEETTTETFNVTLYSARALGWQLVERDGRIAWYCDGTDILSIAFGDFLLSTSVTIPLENPMLTFDTKYSIESHWDFGFVQISTDGGVTWTSLENSYTTYSHDPSATAEIIANLPGLSGTSSGWPDWMTMMFNLTDYAGETVLLGFRYMTDEAHIWEGWYVDNVMIGNISISDGAFEKSNPFAVAIQTMTVSNLAPGANVTLVFSWNTTDWYMGNYNLILVADTIPGEVDIVDNTSLDSSVFVMFIADVNGDGIVDIFDAILLSTAFGAEEGPPNWNPDVDINGDGIVDILDAIILASYFGKTVP